MYSGFSSMYDIHLIEKNTVNSLAHALCSGIISSGGMGLETRCKCEEIQ